MSDYETILNGKWDDVPEPKVLPAGSYLLRGRNATFKASTDEDKSSQVLFVYAPKEAMNDVAQAEIDALGADYDFSLNRIFVRFYVETTADWDNVRKHLAKHGITTQGKGVSETLKEFKGKEVLAYLGSRTYTNGAGIEVTENTASQFAPVEG